MNKMHLSRLIRQHEFWPGLLAVALAVGPSVSTDEFLSLGSPTDVTASYVTLGILVCGLLVVLTFGGIDTSSPAMTVIAQYTMASWAVGHGSNFALVLIIAIAVGLLLGLINGFLVYWLRVPAITIAIATLNVYYGLLVHVIKGIWLHGFPDWFMNGINWFLFTAADGYGYGLTLPLLCLAAVIIFTTVLMNCTRLGRQVYAMGDNCDAALCLELNLPKLHFYVYGHMGILAGIVAVVQVQITQSVVPNSLLGFELTVLAAVVLDGTSMSGGHGTLAGTLLGMVLLAFLQNGLTLLNASSYWHTVFSGAIILVSISATTWSEKRKLVREL